MATINLAGVEKYYGKTPAVRGVDLDVVNGEFLVILGPSGCGKSTLLRMIAGLEDISSGTIGIDGQIVNALEPGERGCAMVFQNYALYPHMSVAENIGYALKVAGVAKAERETRVALVAGMLDLDKLLERKPSQLSGGQRQRVAMGRAMIRSPRVFLFDEPLSNLDAKLRLQMRLEIKRLHRELKTTSIFVTHDQTEAMTLADRIIVMNGGKIEQIGTPKEIYQRPESLFVADFIGSPPMNLIPVHADGAGRLIAQDGSELCPEVRCHESEGAALHLGVRPAALRLVARQTPDAAPFQLEMVEDLADEIHLHGFVGGNRVTLTQPGGSPIPKEPVSVFVPASAVHLYHADDGRRLDLAVRTPLRAVN